MLCIITLPFSPKFPYLYSWEKCCSFPECPICQPLKYRFWNLLGNFQLVFSQSKAALGLHYDSSPYTFCPCSLSLLNQFTCGMPLLHLGAFPSDRITSLSYTPPTKFPQFMTAGSSWHLSPEPGSLWVRTGKQADGTHWSFQWLREL